MARKTMPKEGTTANSAVVESKEPQLVTAGALARRIGVAEKTVRKWGHEGFFPLVKLSRRCVRYPLRDCLAIVESRRVKALSEFE